MQNYNFRYFVRLIAVGVYYALRYIVPQLWNTRRYLFFFFFKDALKEIK